MWNSVINEVYKGIVIEEETWFGNTNFVSILASTLGILDEYEVWSFLTTYNFIFLIVMLNIKDSISNI